jgi:hypothetical protein
MDDFWARKQTRKYTAVATAPVNIVYFLPSRIDLLYIVRKVLAEDI